MRTVPEWAFPHKLEALNRVELPTITIVSSARSKCVCGAKIIGKIIFVFLSLALFFCVHDMNRVPHGPVVKNYMKGSSVI